MRKTIVAVLALGLMFQATAAIAAPTRISPVEYLQRLAIANAKARGLAAKPTPVGMEEVRRILGLPVEVDIRGVIAQVPEDQYLETLDGSSSQDFLNASSHLSRLEASTQEAIATSVPTDNNVDRAIRRAYGGIQLELTPAERIRRAIVGFLMELVARAIYYLGEFRGATTIVAWSVVLAVAAGVTLLIARRVRLVPEAELDRARAAAAGAIDWESEFRAALARGDQPGAVRARFRELLQAMAARGVVEDRPSLTAGECRGAAARSLPTLSPVVTNATHIFERVAYGRTHLRAGELDAMEEAVKKVRAA